MRRSGVLLHISSLDGPYGIGTLGNRAFRFVDFLSASGQSYWQMLPIGPTGYYDSPYQSFSTFAGNPYFIDLELLIEAGLLTPAECAELEAPDGAPVDYGLQYKKRLPLLFRAADRGLSEHSSDFLRFRREHIGWLTEYALFMAIKEDYPESGFSEWPEPLRMRDKEAIAAARKRLSHSVDRWCYLQFLFFSQWRRLRAYANERGVKLIGDVPLYVSSDSAEVWAFPELFQLDGARRQTKQAGVPPDYFSAEGQLWGNPLYDWTFHRETGYDWWIQRLAFMDSLFDVTRIDHFRGFADYCSIDIGADDARQGCFTPGPGMEFFRTLRERLPAVSLIAEDLGLLSEEAKALRLDTGLPGMAVMQFAFSRDMTSEYLPHRMGTNLVVYLGTHDNDTFWGWLSESGPEDETGFARDYMRLSAGEGFSQGAVKMLFASPADLAIVQMQDILGLGSEARMNTPGTLGGNWTWRMGSGVLTKELTEELRHITETYDRLPRSGEI